MAKKEIVRQAVSSDGTRTIAADREFSFKRFIFQWEWMLVLMLLLAAANRFHLGPRLEVMVREGNYDRSVALMRNSILTEFVVAIIILGAVAWLGMLAPSQVS